VRVEIHETLLRDEAGRIAGLHSVLLDVTERRRAEVLDRDRRELSEMIAQQQPLDRILRGVSQMISHQDESLWCVPLKLAGELDRQLEPVSVGDAVEPVVRAIRESGSANFMLRRREGFWVSHRSFAELPESPGGAEIASAASRIGMRSCWSIPIVSSTLSPLGKLLVLTPHSDAPTAAEKQLLEAASRLAGIAIEHRFMTDLLAFQAGHDCLTRLPNRTTFETRLEDAIADARVRGDVLAVFFVDLDGFKSINDTFGHSGGDELLRQVGTRLRQCVRKSDLLARVSGDEFSLLVPGLHEGSEAKRVAEAILKAFEEPYEIDGAAVRVTASIGISLYPQDGLDASTLQRNSDSAMYRVKNMGKNSFRCYAGEKG
jgi:diguanylate cyclase (GGDEF)-like protein